MLTYARRWYQASFLWLPGQELGKNPGSQPGQFCIPQDIWQCLETFFGCHILGGWGSTVIECVEARKAAEHPTMHKMGPHHKELSRSEISSAKVGQPCPSLSVAFLVQEESQEGRYISEIEM